MLEYIVNSSAELKAALMASAQPSFALARAYPVRIQFGSCTYNFPNGVPDVRARLLCARIRHYHPRCSPSKRCAEADDA